MDLKNPTNVRHLITMSWMMRTLTQTTLSPGASWLSNVELNQTLIVMIMKRVYHQILTLLKEVLLEILINLSESQVLVVWIALTMPMGTLGIDINLEEQLLDHGAQRILAQNMPKSDISRRHQRLCPPSHFIMISHFQGHRHLEIIRDHPHLQGTLLPWNLKIRQEIPNWNLKIQQEIPNSNNKNKRPRPLEAQFQNLGSSTCLKALTMQEAKRNCPQLPIVFQPQDLVVPHYQPNSNRLHLLMANCPQELRHLR